MSLRWTFYEVFEGDCEEGTGRKRLPDAYTAGIFLDQFKEEYIWNFSI